MQCHKNFLRDRPCSEIDGQFGKYESTYDLLTLTPILVLAPMACKVSRHTSSAICSLTRLVCVLQLFLKGGRTQSKSSSLRQAKVYLSPRINRTTQTVVR